MELTSWLWNLVPFAAMIAVECTDVGVSTISKAALAKGMSKYVSVVYYNALATLILLPYFIFHRSTGQILFLAAVKLSSPTLSSALANLIPIFTFLLAVITRMETLDIRRSSSQAKSLGAIVSVAGAFVVTLYKGPAVLMTTQTSNFHHHHQLLFSQKPEWIFGGFLLLIVCLLSATWNVAQGATVKEYQEPMTIVFFFTFFITIQSAVFSLILERNPNAWILKSSIEIIAIVFTAVFGSIFRIAIHTWCLRKKGPVYVAMFKPLGIAIAVFMTVVFLGDTLYLGSVIGSIIIALGFYSVMWGQMKEKKMGLNKNNEACCSNSSSLNAPLIRRTASEA
ncbi:WAT1-related protein At5g40240 isoform X2 [Ricinus communis]|uniref:WAT1-related protein At5g40240 isoform X2 n=1 Tax=Ricinus communis TaxID=3988 RepID=UPI0007721B6F|nr:WAT1-related protein At5g40240 isoform X2 [Ricinus communis]|eukprot:XP_015573631.1 WAT1-related protein At5g40240 isoform X2 [Ricinus communis]